ncbi:MAG: hypothetical protein Q4A15_11410 [Prevotellaceae bacterium]|nr:hypothetical protein [Prevotellaceae bacterium]
MKVYVITKGDYSAYHICSVTTDKKKAKLLKEKYSKGYGKAQIETFDTDSEEEVLKYENLYNCHYYENDSSIRITQSDFDYFEQDDLKVGKFLHGLYTSVLANNEEDALKIASDKFAKHRSEKIGL